MSPSPRVALFAAACALVALPAGRAQGISKRFVPGPVVASPTGVGQVDTPWADQPPPDGIHIAIIGDSNSTTWSEGTDWPQSLGHEISTAGQVVYIHNFAIPAASLCYYESQGAYYHGLKQIADAFTAGFEYDYIVNHLGVVDVLFLTPAAEAYAHHVVLTGLIEATFPDAKVFSSTIHNLCPHYPLSVDRNALIDEYNALLLAQGTNVIDLGAPIVCDDHLASDGIHTNFDGRLLKAATVGDVIKTELGLLP